MAANSSTVVASSAKREPAAGGSCAWSSRVGIGVVMGIGVVRAGMAARVIVVRRRRPAWESRMRAHDRDAGRDEEAEQRQEDDGLVHRDQPFMRLMSSTAIEPRLR